MKHCFWTRTGSKNCYKMLRRWRQRFNPSPRIPHCATAAPAYDCTTNEVFATVSNPAGDWAVKWDPRHQTRRASQATPSHAHARWHSMAQRRSKPHDEFPTEGDCSACQVIWDSVSYDFMYWYSCNIRPDKIVPEKYYGIQKTARCSYKLDWYFKDISNVTGTLLNIQTVEHGNGVALPRGNWYFSTRKICSSSCSTLYWPIQWCLILRTPWRTHQSLD